MISNKSKKLVLPFIGNSSIYSGSEIEINPSKIICLGRNYKAHTEELGDEVPDEPILFPKLNNVLIGPNENIVIPKILSKIGKPRVDYEGELAIIIGKQCKSVNEEDAFSYILGYTCFNDVTARELQAKDIKNSLPWFKSKSLDTFGPIGPVVVSAQEIQDPNKLELKTILNGKVVQKVNTADMIFRVGYLIEYISSYFMLEAGDIIATGTPSGIGQLKEGDLIEINIEGIGTLKNRVVKE